MMFTIDINNPLFDTKAHVAQCPPPKEHITGGGDVTPKRSLLHTLIGGMQMGFINV